MGGLAAAEGRRWVRAALEAVDATTPPAVAAKLDLADAQPDERFMQYKAGHAAAQRALARYRKLGAPLGTALAQRLAGAALVFWFGFPRERRC